MTKRDKRVSGGRSSARIIKGIDYNHVGDLRGALREAAKFAVEALEQRLMLTVAAPSNLLASPDSSPGGSASLLLSWQDNSANETSFKIKRSTDGTSFSQIDTVSANISSYSDTTVTAGTHYWYEVLASNATEDSAASNISDAVEWASSNIGSVTGGSASTSSGVTTIVTAGNGIGWTSDDFRYDYRTLSGDGYIIAKVTGVQYTNALARAGVMFRNTLAANSREVMMAITPGSGADFISRDADGNTANENLYSGYASPYWLKLVREGSQFSGYVSSNGTTWSLIRQVNVSMGTNVYVGLGVSSSGYGASNTSTFSNVSVTRTDHSLPSGWSDQDLGSASFAGSARFYNDTFTFAVESSGQNIGGTSDAFHFAHRTLIGDGEMIARVASVQTGYSLAKAGIMFRDGMGADAKNIFLAISAGSGAVWQNRATVGGNASETWSTGKSAPYYVRITRLGNTFTGYLSTDGSTWSQIGSSVTISGMSSSLEVGIALSAAGYGALNTSSFDNVKMISAVPVLSATLVHAGRIDLSWTDNSGSETGFILQRSEDNGSTWVQLGGGDLHGSGFVDDTVDSSKTYKYRVKSFIDDLVRGESDWSAPPVSATTSGLGNGLAATYYDNIDFSGNTATRTDQSIGFLWNDGQAPISGIAASTFTTEWKGQILAPATGTYTFSALSDDGARVWINNQLVLNDWDVHSPSTATGHIALAANTKYDVRIEYFQNFGSAEIFLNWVVPGASTGTNAVAIPTANFYSQTPNQPPAAPATPTGVIASSIAATDVATTPRVDISWEGVTGADVYVIYRSGDNGATWAVAGSALSNQSSFRDDYTGLDTSAHYLYRVMAIGAGGRSGLADALTGPSNLKVTLATTGDANVVTWDSPTGNTLLWHLERSTDSGANWQPVGNFAPSASSVTDPRNAGTGATYLYRMWGETTMVRTPVSWSGDQAGADTVVNLPVQYFNNTALSGTPSVTTTVPYTNGKVINWASHPITGSTTNLTNFSARISAVLTAPTTGWYTFSTKVDGGVRLFIGGVQKFELWQDVTSKGDTNGDGLTNFADLVAVAQNYGNDSGTRTAATGDVSGDGNVGFPDLVLVAQNYGLPGSAQVVPGTDNADAGKVYLSANQQITITIEYFNATAFASLGLLWTKPDNTTELVPADRFSNPSTTPAAPTSPSASAQSSTSVALSWTAASGATGYVIERKDAASGDFTEVVRVGVSSTYTDGSASPGHTYTYRLKSINLAGESAYATASAVTTPSALSAPTLTMISGTLHWNNITSATGYSIERKDIAVGSWTVQALSVINDGNGNSHADDTSLTAGQEYIYRIRATSSTSSSDYSNTVDYFVGSAGPFDLDIDSDNTNDVNDGGPDGNADEEASQNDPTLPGKILAVDDGDVDGDHIPDLADFIASGLHFVPIVLRLPTDVNVNTATLKLTYDASNPATISSGAAPDANRNWYSPDSGALRLWTKDGSTQRLTTAVTSRNLSDTTNGYYVAGSTSGVTYSGSDFQKLGFDPSTGVYTVTLYVEAVRPSATQSDLTISAEFDADGAGTSAQPVAQTARLTAVQASPAYYGDQTADALGGVAFGVAGEDPASLEYSGPVRYADGSLTYSSSDLDPSENGILSGQTRTWTNRPGQTGDGVNGNGTLVSQWPSLIQATGGILALGGGKTSRWFDFDGTNYHARFFGGETLGKNSGQFVLTDSRGNRLYYFGFDSATPARERGKLDKLVDAGGDTTQLTYGTDGRVTKAERSKSGQSQVLERLTYSYLPDGHLGNVVMERYFADSVTPHASALTIVRQVTYEYYGAGATYGTAGSLARVTVSRVDTTQQNKPVAVEHKLYRYDASGRLTVVVEGASYERLVNALGTADPLTAAATDVNPYANYIFGYDAQGRVNSQTVQGMGTYTYDYSANTGKVGVNTWKYKTIETLPDTSTNTIYSDHNGEVLLRVLSDGIHQWKWAYKYASDGSGRLVLSAMPSAIGGLASPDTGAAYPVTLQTNSGLTNFYQYYSTTGSGGAAGYLSQEGVQKGTAGESDIQESYEYTPRGGVGAPSSNAFVVSKLTQYQGTGAQRATVTNYTFDVWNGLEVGQRTTTLPIVSTSQNGKGAGTPTTVVEQYDTFGRPTQITDGDGRVHTASYEDSTGAVKQEVADAGTGNLNLITTTYSDGLGRTRSMIDPSGHTITIDYTVESAAVLEVQTTPPALLSGTALPIEVTREDRTHGFLDTFTLSQNNSVVESFARQSFNISGQLATADRYSDTKTMRYSSTLGVTNVGASYRTQYGYDARGRQNKVTDALGTITRTVYDALSRPTSIWIGTNDSGWTPTSPGSNMTLASQSQYDSYATDGSSAAGNGNLTQVTQFPNDGTANRQTQMFYDWRDRNVATKAGAEALAAEGTSAGLAVNRPITYVKYDNLDRPLAQYIYDGDGVVVSDANGDGVPDQPDAGTLRSATVTQYDDRSRTFRTTVFSVNQISGGDPTAGLSLDSLTASQIATAGGLSTDIWYNDRDNAIKVKQPGGLITKSEFDGAGREVKKSVTDGGISTASPDTTWADAGNVTGDMVLEQDLTIYDASDNTIFSLKKERDHNATATGDLDANDARVSAVAQWFDEADRLVTTVNYGNNGDDSQSFLSGGTYLRPSKPARATNGNSDSSPNAAKGFDRWLRTDLDYDTAGREAMMTDPRGIKTRTYYDALDRKTGVTEAYTGNLSSIDPSADPAPGVDTNRKTLFAYNGLDEITQETAVTYNPAVPGTPLNQTTHYFYGVTKGGSYAINSNGLLSRTAYDIVPDDPNAGLPVLSGLSADDVTVAGYNALGETTKRVERNGTTHEFKFDTLGRQTSDKWTATSSFSSSFISNWADERQTQYDALGRGVKFSMVKNGDAQPVKNEVERVYDGLGNLVTEYQEHNGPVNHSTSAKVQYTFDTNFASDYSRLTTLSYPSLGRQLTYTYRYDGDANNTTNAVAALNDAISRVAKVEDLTYAPGVQVPGERNAYLGLDTVVLRRYQGVKKTSTAAQTMELNYFGVSDDIAFNSYMPDDAGTSDPYFGLDRFGRVVAQEWDSFGDDYEIGYDADGNTLYHRMASSGDYANWRSEIYHAQGADAFSAYDQLNRMKGFARGVMSPTNKSTVSSSGSSDVRETHNEFAVDTGGYTETNASDLEPINRGKIYQKPLVNPTTARDFGANIDPSAHRRDYFLTYDSWGQLITQSAASPVWSGTGTLYSYGRVFTNGFVYDALGRRIKEVETDHNNATKTTDLYYDANGQMIEEKRAEDGRVRQYLFSAASPGMMFAQYDSQSPSGGDLTWVAQGPDASVWSLAVDKQIGNGSFKGSYLISTPDGRTTFLNVTGLQIWSLTEQANTDWRYTWHGGRMVNDQDLNFAGSTIVDRQSGLLLMPDGALYDATTGTPLTQDKYAFFRPSTGTGEFAANANQFSGRGMFLINSGHNGTTPYWQADTQYTKYALGVAVTGLALGTSLIVGSVAGGLAGSLLSSYGSIGAITAGFIGGFAGAFAGSLATQYGLGQDVSFGTAAKEGLVFGLVGGVTSGVTYGIGWFARANMMMYRALVNSGWSVSASGTAARVWQGIANVTGAVSPALAGMVGGAMGAGYGAWSTDAMFSVNYGKLVGNHYGAAPTNMVRPHGHHIVYKGAWSGSPTMQRVLGSSRRILERYDIDWLNGLENLTWAPNRGHSIEQAKKVLAELYPVRNEGRDAVVKVLRSIAKRLENGTF